MCGILFGVGYSKSKFSMGQSRIFHRGPDVSSSIFLENEQRYFGFQRLSIQDLSLKASQPYWSRSKRFLLLYNGEIYNKKTLTTNFLMNREMNTESDTEVIAEMLEKMGVRRTLNLLEGMFAFCIYDTLTKKTILARDYFGIKRLYWYGNRKNQFIAASEISAIFEIIKTPKPNLNAIHDWINHGLIDHNENTFFDGINVLPAGHLMEIDEFGNIEITDWRNELSHIEFTNQKQYLMALEETLFEIVESSLIGDVKMGTLLSGGIDSSLLFEIVKKFDSDMKAYTLDWNNENYSEIQWINEITKPKNHIVVQSTESEIFERIPKSLKHYCQPFGSPFLIGMEKLFYQAKRNGNIVMFDGNGLDEFFLGYSKYRTKSKSSDFSKLSQDNTNGLRPKISGRFLGDCNQFNCKKYYEIGSIEVDEMRKRDIFTSKLPRALRYSDQASMMYSCELRVPFVNQRLYSLALSARFDWLQDKNLGKKPIRQILSSLTNSDASFAEKRAVQLPMREWFVKDWDSKVCSILSEYTLKQKEWIDLDSFFLEYTNFKNSYSIDTSNALFLWQWLSLALWSNEFVQ